jgi:hypothetical protein
MSVKKERDHPILAVMNKALGEMGDMKNKEDQKQNVAVKDDDREGYVVKQERGEIMSNLETKKSLISERLLRSYKRWRIIIKAVICFVMLFILAFLLTMFICKKDC